MAVGTRSKLSHFRWGALALAVVAYLSLYKFPGLSGALGAGGWLLIAAAVYCYPSDLGFNARPGTGSWRIVVVFGIALLFVVGSVVVWSLER